MAKVELELMRWAVDHEASEGEDATGLLPEYLTVDGELFYRKDAKLVFDGFISVELKASPRFRARYEPSEYLAETTDETLVLPVTELDVRQRVIA